MKEIIFEKLGKPLEVLELRESEIPTPKENEVLIRVTARNINPSDLMFIQGLYGITPRLPSSAGFEASGVIEKADGAGRFSKGMRVMFTGLGTWREYMAVPVGSVIPVPQNMPDEIACQAFVNPLTAFGMLEESGLGEGEWLLITAGASAFGKFAIQLAKEKGIKVAATVRHDDQIELLKKLGADLVVNTEKEKIYRVIPEQTGGGVHVVFDAVSGKLGAQALSCLRANGKMMVFGALSLDNMPINSGLLIFRNLTIEGFWLSTWTEKLDHKARIEAFGKVFHFLMKEDAQVDIAGKFPLESFREAILEYEKPGRNGKILLMG